ncbi:MAG: preprotein translocase subunit SecY [Cyclobacteriaceae bacterium]
MKKFFDTIKNIFSIEELRNRILTTLGLLVIFRIGSFVVLPGLNPDILAEQAANTTGILSFIDTFLGGAFSRASIFALGIMPYISASIVLQLMTVAVPYFQKLQKEGDSGRKKINQITRVLTIGICLAQSIPYLTAYVPAEAINTNLSPFMFRMSSMVILASGTVFCMWLGERITDKGIGNGISLLIMVGIIARFPGSILAEFYAKGMSGLLVFILEIVALFFVVLVTVALVQAVRRVPVSYAKQVVGNKVYGGQRQYIPLKVNASGVMPIIFAQSLMFLPAMLGGLWAESSDNAQYIVTTFSDFTSWQYSLTFAILIIVFTFFYTAITINPNQMADDMKRNGGFVPGIKPGKQTSEFLDTILSRITLPGSIFLAIIAVLPAFAMIGGVEGNFAQFYGGTSLLIMVGVILDTLQQIESYLLMRHYEGMMSSGRIKGRTAAA